MTVAKRDIHVMETFTGLYVDLLDPKPEQICLLDIAVGLSNVCRFGGQVSRWYSVAEHSVRCAEACEGTIAPLYALFHDAHEAYTGDLVSGLKHILGDAIRDIQNRLDVAIAQHFGISHAGFKNAYIKAIDDEVMFREAAGLKHSRGVGEHWGNDTPYEPFEAFGWKPSDAERRFIDTYRRLSNA